jgi:membrane-bound serine protease (ClpP class)
LLPANALVIIGSGLPNMPRITIRFISCVAFLLILTLALISHEVDADTQNIEILRIEGTIVPVVADYVDRGISRAEAKGNALCIIELNTPGGLLDTTEKIVRRILNAKVPVVVYVSPHGSWAASAGTFITISGHIAAMAPGTTIGAAHPVSVGESMPDEVQKKATEYSSAWIRSIAETRGRDSNQAELAVRESKSFTAAQALENHLVDLQAADLESLIKQLNGRRIILASKEEIVIDIGPDMVTRNEMNWIERFLQTISNPNIAYILLSLASIGLITEISNPGMIFPGVVGGICLFVAFYALGTLNAYWAGVLLILLAFGLFISEIFIPAFGILTAGGVVSFIIGSLVLFSNNPQSLTVDTGLIAVVVIIIVVFVIFAIGAIVRGQRRQIATGVEVLIGKTAVVRTTLNPRGSVFVEGELWAASIDDGSVESGEEVLITKVEGLKLLVTRKEK